MTDSTLPFPPKVSVCARKAALARGGGQRAFAWQAVRLIHEQLPTGVGVCRQVDDWLLKHWSLGASYGS